MRPRSKSAAFLHGLPAPVAAGIVTSETLLMRLRRACKAAFADERRWHATGALFPQDVDGRRDRDGREIPPVPSLEHVLDELSRIARRGDQAVASASGARAVAAQGPAQAGADAARGEPVPSWRPPVLAPLGLIRWASSALTPFACSSHVTWR